MKYFLALFIIMGTTAHAATITTEQIDITLIGNANHSKIAIASPNTNQSKPTKTYCTQIQQLIIAQNSSLQLSLPPQITHACKETH